MTSAGTSGREGEQAATSASDMGSDSSEGAPASATGASCAAARPAARSPAAGLAALVGVPSSSLSRSRFVGVVSAPLPCRTSSNQLTLLCKDQASAAAMAEAFLSGSSMTSSNYCSGIPKFFWVVMEICSRGAGTVSCVPR